MVLQSPWRHDRHEDAISQVQCHEVVCNKIYKWSTPGITVAPCHTYRDDIHALVVLSLNHVCAHMLETCGQVHHRPGGSNKISECVVEPTCHVVAMFGNVHRAGIWAMRFFITMDHPHTSRQPYGIYSLSCHLLPANMRCFCFANDWTCSVHM